MGRADVTRTSRTGETLFVEQHPALTDLAPSPARDDTAAVDRARYREWSVTAVAAMAALIGAVVGALTGVGVALWVDDDGATERGREVDIPAVIQRVTESVVAIDVVAVSYFGTQPIAIPGAGTGFVFDADGIIVTNAHVVEETITVTVRFSDGTELHAALVGTDLQADLAVLRVNREGLVPLVAGRSSDLRAGDAVIAIGNALGMEGNPTASLGIISAVDRDIIDEDGLPLRHLIQTDAAINRGDSGGPLVDLDGAIVGINTATSISGENIGFAIPIEDALPIIKELRSEE